MRCLKCNSSKLIKKGKIKTRKRGKAVQRFQCKECSYKFTSRSVAKDFMEKRPDLNKQILSLYVEDMKLRGISRHLNCSYDTVMKKFKKLGCQAQIQNLKKDGRTNKCKIIQIDEMHTFVGDRFQKRYVAVAVSGWGQILCFKTGADRDQLLNEFMLELNPFVDENTIFYCDKDTKYTSLINKHYPQADYVDMSGRNSDEYLKHLNFVCALVRNRLSRMARKSWCFSRKTENLQLNLDLLKYNFNQRF